MFGIDLGLNTASVVLIATRKVAYHKVLKGNKEGTDFERITNRAKEIVSAVAASGFSASVTIEEPVYSWGRRNPRVFGKLMMLLALTRFLLESSGYKVFLCNNKSAKKMAGCGMRLKSKESKAKMIKAFRRETKQKILHFPIYYQETMVDSYWIARAGLQQNGRS